MIKSCIIVLNFSYLNPLKVYNQPLLKSTFWCLKEAKTFLPWSIKETEDSGTHHSLFRVQQCPSCLFSGPTIAFIPRTEIPYLGKMPLPIHTWIYIRAHRCSRPSTVCLGLLQVYRWKRRFWVSMSLYHNWFPL